MGANGDRQRNSQTAGVSMPVPVLRRSLQRRLLDGLEADVDVGGDFDRVAGADCRLVVILRPIDVLAELFAGLELGDVAIGADGYGAGYLFGGGVPERRGLDRRSAGEEGALLRRRDGHFGNVLFLGIGVLFGCGGIGTAFGGVDRLDPRHEEDGPGGIAIHANAQGLGIQVDGVEGQVVPCHGHDVAATG